MNPETLVKEFHKKFDMVYEGPSRPLPPEMGWRVEFLQEELNEYREAIEEGNLEKQFDALIDLVYVALGNAYMQGFPFMNGFALVHLANMKKVKAMRPEDSKRNSVFDIVKPEGWTPPNLEPLLIK